MEEKKSRSKLGKMSRNKGKTFERKVSNMLTARGIPARRAVQFDGMFDYDIAVDLPFNFECKAVESLNLYKAMSQSKADARRTEAIPTVVHKKNRMETLITMPFTDFIDMLQWCLGYVDEENTLDLAEFREKWIAKKQLENDGEDYL